MSTAIAQTVRAVFDRTVTRTWVPLAGGLDRALDVTVNLTQSECRDIFDLNNPTVVTPAEAEKLVDIYPTAVTGSVADMLELVNVWCMQDQFANANEKQLTGLMLHTAAWRLQQMW